MTLSHIRHNHLHIIVLLVLTTLSVSTTAQEIRFNIGVKAYPPYTILEQDGAINGIMVDVLEKVASATGYHVEYLEIPRKRVDMMIEQGLLDATPRAIEWTMEAERFLFTDPIISIRDVLFSPASKPLQFERIEELVGTRLRTHVGYRYEPLEKYFANGLIYRHDDAYEEQMLNNLIMSKRRFDAAIVDELVGYWLINENQWEGQLVASNNAIASVGYRLMFNKSFAAFVKRFNAALEDMKSNSELQTIIDKYTTKQDKQISHSF